jgi:hypothetical protein
MKIEDRLGPIHEIRVQDGKHRCIGRRLRASAREVSGCTKLGTDLTGRIATNDPNGNTEQALIEISEVPRPVPKSDGEDHWQRFGSDLRPLVAKSVRDARSAIARPRVEGTSRDRRLSPVLARGNPTELQTSAAQHVAYFPPVVLMNRRLLGDTPSDSSP